MGRTPAISKHIPFVRNSTNKLSTRFYTMHSYVFYFIIIKRCIKLILLSIIIIIYINLPSNVRGCNVTQPVWTYSTNCRNTSASNSSITITVGDVTLAALLIDVATVPTKLPLLYFDQDVDALDPVATILLLFLILFLFGGDFCCCYEYFGTSLFVNSNTQDMTYK